jgi:hypothetical protein
VGLAVGRRLRIEGNFGSVTSVATQFAENSKQQIPHRLNRPLKKSPKQIPRGLKPTRNDKNKGINYLASPTGSEVRWELKGMSKFKQGWRSFKEGISSRLFWQYLLAVKEHAWEVAWGAGMIGIPLTIITLYVSPSLRSLGWVAAICILVGGYYVWRAEYVRRLPVERQVTKADWDKLATDFESCSHYIRADYSRCGRPPYDTWHVFGAPSSANVDKCKSLCNLAGAMLLRSPHVFSELSSQAQEAKDPTYRWLYFLKDRTGLENILTGVEQYEDGGTSAIIAGHINDVPSRSTAACIDCAAKEL